MSRLFVATDRRLNRRVVVKVLPEYLSDDSARERFAQEILLAAGLQHPHIVPVLSAGEAAGRPYFVMPLVEGESLRQRLERGPLSVRETVTILRDLGRALAFAHEHGIVHRDLKPDNVLLSPGGSATLTDFGVAKARRAARERRSQSVPDPVTLSGVAFGTPAYMAPEQAAGGPDVDGRADIYTLGITAYEMLAGRPPFHDRSPTGLIAAQITEPAPALTRDDVPPPLAALVAECLAKDPAERPQSAREVLARLEDPGLWSGRVAKGGPAHAGRRTELVALGAVLALAAVIGVGVGIARWNARRVANRRSIVVLPLVDVNHDTADAYFSAGLTDQLTSALDQVPDLRVASRTAADALRGEEMTPQQIGRLLDVATLLEGTVERSGDSIRIDVSLVSATNGLDLWSGAYPARLRDVFAVQDSVTAAIVGALRERFGGGGGAPVSPGQRTQDVAALDSYLRGRFALHHGGEAALRRAIEFFGAAVRQDSDYAAAYTGLADAYGLLSLYSRAPADTVIPLGLRAADRAIALDPTIGPAFASRASLEMAVRRWSDAERDFRKAIALDPDYAAAHQRYGELLAVEGRMGQAVRQLREARRLDPLSAVIGASYGAALGTVGDYTRAIAEGRRAVSLAPTLPVTHLLLGQVYVDAGQLARALGQLEAASRLQPGLPATEGALGFGYGASGQRSRARQMVENLMARGDPDRVGLALARVYLGLGDLDSALVWLGRGAEHGDPAFSSQSLAAPMFDPLRGDRRFAAVVRALHLDPKALGG